MTSVVALIGPTGVGKTDVGIALAAAYNAEIINADSRQVYRRLNIGSAKPTPAQRAAVPHHLIDVVDPDEAFDCARFRDLALAAVADIVARGKRVLVVGGTGLYIKALLWGLFAGPSRDATVRAELEREEAAAPGSLHRRLTAVDPATAARVHPNDRVRLVRALEVFILSGRPISVWQADHAFAAPPFESLTLGLALPRTELYARIDARCQAMIEAGLVDEVRALYADGLDPGLAALRSPGYREIGDYVRGRCDLSTAVARMAQVTRRLAKRQLTWFRADQQVVWCPPDADALRGHVDAFVWSREISPPIAAPVAVSLQDPSRSSDPR